MMIVVEDIKTFLYNKEEVNHYRFMTNDTDSVPIQTSDGKKEFMDANVVSELIKGREFINVLGQPVVIGMAKHVQDAIGLPFKAFQDQERHLWEMHRENVDLRDEIVKIKTMSFWNKLKFLFMGAE